MVQSAVIVIILTRFYDKNSENEIVITSAKNCLKVKAIKIQGVLKFYWNAAFCSTQHEGQTNAVARHTLLGDVYVLWVIDGAVWVQFNDRHFTLFLLVLVTCSVMVIYVTNCC